MVTPILIDILIVAALLFFAWRGSKKGFVLTLCSLVAVIVALLGASIVSDALAPKVADAIQPRLEQSIRESLEKKALEVNAQDYLGAEDVLAALKDKGGVYEWAAGGLEELMRSSLAETIPAQAAAAATAVAEQLARGILFSVSFLLILIAWFFVSHALDLVAKLPVIHSLNEALGGVLGLAKGLVICYIAAWVLCSATQAIPPQMVEETHLLRLLTGFSLLA